MTDIDQMLTKQAIELLHRLEDALPPTARAMFCFYNGVGQDLSLIVAGLNGHDEGDNVKVLRALLDRYQAQNTAPGKRYVAPTRAEGPYGHVISSAEVFEAGAHERVRLWSRGGLAGELVVSKGDGARMCAVMFMLQPENEE